MRTNFSAQPKLLNRSTFKQTTIKCKGKGEREKKKKKQFISGISHSSLLTGERCPLLTGIAIPKISENCQDIRKTKVLAHRLHIY